MKTYAFPLLLLVAFLAAVTLSGSAVAGDQCCVKNAQDVCIPCPENAKATATSGSAVDCKLSAECKPVCCPGQGGACAIQTKATGVTATAVTATVVKATAVKASAAACNPAAQCNGKVCVPCDPEECKLSCEKTASQSKIAL